MKKFTVDVGDVEKCARKEIQGFIVELKKYLENPKLDFFKYTFTVQEFKNGKLEKKIEKDGYGDYGGIYIFSMIRAKHGISESPNGRYGRE